MLQVVEKLDGPLEAQATVTLSFDQRQKSRLRLRLDDGREVALRLGRGEALHGGDRLRTTDGLVIEVRAAEEDVSTAHSENQLTLTRASYHLGNRHVPLEIGSGWIRYAHDDVLDAMVRQLGLEVRRERAGFEPETGAYRHGTSHRHA